MAPLRMAFKSYYICTFAMDSYQIVCTTYLFLVYTNIYYQLTKYSQLVTSSSSDDTANFVPFYTGIGSPGSHDPTHLDHVFSLCGYNLFRARMAQENSSSLSEPENSQACVSKKLRPRGIAGYKVGKFGHRTRLCMGHGEYFVHVQSSVCI